MVAVTSRNEEAPKAMRKFVRTPRASALSAVFVLCTIASVFALSAFEGREGRDPGGMPVAGPNSSPKRTMQAFASDTELKAYFRRLSEERSRELARSRRESAGNLASAPASVAQPSEAKWDSTGPAADKADSITNTQHAGVDERGIVKLHGDHLVILRRGRLFTVAIGDGALKPVSALDAFGPEIVPRSTWYDELLVSEDTVAVIGYSYERGGTEVGLFRIDSAGNLTYRSTYHLR